MATKKSKKKLAIETVAFPSLVPRKKGGDRFAGSRGTPTEQLVRRMRHYVADALGCDEKGLPGLEASVLTLAMETKVLQQRIASAITMLTVVDPSSLEQLQCVRENLLGYFIQTRARRTK